MPHFDDKTGRQFGRLTVLVLEGKNRHKQSLWRCRCSCGRETIVTSFNLTSGMTRSCGCGHLTPDIKTHGRSKTREFSIWANMVARCHHSRNKSYRFYGARGITVCEAWREDFAAFLADVGVRPSPSHSSHGTKTSARNCISTRTSPSPSHASHRPPGTLNEKWLAVRPRALASLVAANNSRIGSNAFRYVTGFDRGVRPIGV